MNLLTKVSKTEVTGPPRINVSVAGRLDEVAQLLEDQGANIFRIGAYRRAAAMLRGLDRPIDELVKREGVDADIYDRGITLTGGGAQLSGLETCLRDRTGIPVKTADEPKYATVRGLAQMLDEPLTLRRLTRRPSNQLSWAGNGTFGG